MCIMNDWKLKTTPVVRLQQPDETFVQYNFFVFLMELLTSHTNIAVIQNSIQNMFCNMHI